MRSILQSFAEGGIFMYLVIVAGLIGIIIAFLQFVLIKKFSLWPMILGSAAGTILLGLLGSLNGLIASLGALEMAAPEQKAALMARGVAICINVGLLATVMAAIQTFFGSIACTVRANIKRKQEQKANPT